MGLMCSWIAIRGAPPSAIFEKLELVPTGEIVEPWSREEAFSYRRMASAEVWRLSYAPSRKGGSEHRLTSTGTLPANARSATTDDEADLYDIPIQAAQAICDFNLDVLEDTEIEFVGLRPAGAKARAATSGRATISGRILDGAFGFAKRLMSTHDWLDQKVYARFPRPIHSGLNFLSLLLFTVLGLAVVMLPLQLLMGPVSRIMDGFGGVILVLALAAGLAMTATARWVVRKLKPSGSPNTFEQE